MNPTQTQQNPLGVRKTFFGKDNCLVLQVNTEEKKTFLQIGKRGPAGWTWNKAKINNEEIGDILRVLESKTEGASFYHRYQGKETKIWISRKADNVYFRIENQSKALSPGQQTVMAILLRHAIVTTSTDDRPPTKDTHPAVETETVR